ncbi:unnamed protein product [Litomosoides sigmodontis]|uniref:Abnormal cell migration protein 18-like fibronectin type I domain-containing protein n=1 Tax=Litomosoides sigmodontis TaxID=42156 RepID=A0A3P7K0X4_LITSI|nr:unnamed protein product [Litomosoides sigmodontis]
MRSEYFLMQCAENGYKILGCFYRDNSNKTVDVKLGTVTEADGVEHHCEDIMGCIKNGIRYKEGEQFAKNHLRYECKNGMVTITGCYMEKEQEKLEIGNSAVNSNMLYKCYFENGGVMFEQYPCGLRGTPTCEIPKGELTRMPPAMLAPKPGYKAFGMVQVRTFKLTSTDYST